MHVLGNTGMRWGRQRGEDKSHGKRVVVVLLCLSCDESRRSLGYDSFSPDIFPVVRHHLRRLIVCVLCALRRCRCVSLCCRRLSRFVLSRDLSLESRVDREPSRFFDGPAKK